jgi:Mycoplasma protein of unknown function, DUF285
MSTHFLPEEPPLVSPNDFQEKNELRSSFMFQSSCFLPDLIATDGEITTSGSSLASGDRHKSLRKTLSAPILIHPRRAKKTCHVAFQDGTTSPPRSDQQLTAWHEETQSQATEKSWRGLRIMVPARQSVRSMATSSSTVTPAGESTAEEYNPPTSPTTTSTATPNHPHFYAHNSRAGMSTITFDEAILTMLFPKTKRMQGVCVCLVLLIVACCGAVAVTCGLGYCESTRPAPVSGSQQEGSSSSSSDPNFAPAPPPSAAPSVRGTNAVAPSSSSPPPQTAVFRTTQELYDGVDAYAQDPANPYSQVAQDYGYPLGSWDVSRLKNFSRVFDAHRNAVFVNFTYTDALRWNTSKASTMRFMFRGAEAMDPDLSGFDTGMVATMEGMFSGAIHFSGRGISNWDVARVMFMQGMCTYFVVRIRVYLFSNSLIYLYFSSVLQSKKHPQ